MSSSRTTKVIALSLGRGLTTLISLVSGMVMARVLSQSELATYRQTFLAYDIALPFLGLGVNQGIYYFLPTEKRRARGVVVDALVMMVVMGLMYAVFIALGGNHILAKRFSNPAIVHTLVYLVPLPIIMLPAGLLGAVMVVQEQVTKLTIYNVLSSLVLTSCVLGGCLLWKTPEAMVLVRVGATLLTGLVAIVLIIQALPHDDWRPRLSNMKTMLTFSIPLVLASAAGSIFLQLDKLIVSAMCSPEEFAVYSTGAMEVPVIGMVTGSIASVILPDLRRMVAVGDNTAALMLFRKAAEKSSIFLLPIMLFLMVSAEPFIVTLFSSKYRESTFPFLVYLIALPIRVAQYGPFQIALGMKNTILYRSLVSLLVNLILSVILVKWMGYMGAVIATVITLYCVNSVWNIAVISRKVKCRWWAVLPFKSMFQILGVSTMAGLPVLFANHLLKSQVQVQTVLIVNVVMYGVFFIGVAWLFRVKPIVDELIRMSEKATTFIRRLT